jgi:phosphomannomutase
MSTPQLSFTIRELEAIGGINITASHNPPEYNGMKIYNENGAQLLPSHETKLSTHITKTNIYNISWGDFNTRELLNRVHFIPESVENRYHKAVAQISLSRNRSAKIVFTPLHGTGRTSVFKVLKNMGFNVYLEPEGSFPSGEFESVPNHLPDPANLNVYWHAINQADKKKADIIIATDPDADRAGIMIKNNNKWELLNGNEVNILLTYLVLEKYKKLKSSEIKPVILSTITTTRLIEVITANYKCKAKTDILPGFRYIAKEIEKLDKDKSEKLAIAMDDNYGQLAGCYARDKDGCTASILLSQLTGELKDNKLTLYSVLNAAYTKFGFYSSTDYKLKFNFSFESVKIENLMSKLRKKQSALFEYYKVSTFKDYFDLDKPDHSTDLVEFTFEKLGNFDYIRLLIRPSGTEAALKLYIEVGTQKGLSEIEKLRKEANRLHIELKNYFVDYLKKLQA